MDQDKSQKGTLSVTFDLPGVYLLHCKIHPYMTAVVGVKDATGKIPDVTSAMLPFIGNLGLSSLPAETVLSVLTTVAATDVDKLAKWDIMDSSATVKPAIPGVGEVWVDTQFERVTNQRDLNGALKPGTITVMDAATFTVEREIMANAPAECGTILITCGLTSPLTLSIMATGLVSGLTRSIARAAEF